MDTTITTIFFLTYTLIASRRLRFMPIGRPAGALLGAVLMVAVGALTPEESYRAIDHDTILLLFGTMMLTGYLERAGLFAWLAGKMVSLCPTATALLWGTILLSGGLSALLVNDTVCLFLTPVVVTICSRAGLPPAPYLLALATSANIGSAATLVGNPQNMIIGSMSGFPFARFAGLAGPVAGLGLLVNGALLELFYGRRLAHCRLVLREEQTRKFSGSLPWALTVTGGVITGYFAGCHLGYTTLVGVCILVLLDKRDPRDVFLRVDWALLLFFCSLFIVVAGLAKTGLVEACWQWCAPSLTFARPEGIGLFGALVTLGSNVISNVPMVMLTGPSLPALGAPDLGWLLLSWVSTVAGNLTLLGSVANIIVAETARDTYQIGFFEYLRFGVPSTLLVGAIGVPLLVFLV